MNTDYVLAPGGGEAPAITSEWIKEALLPLAEEICQDSCDVGEGWMDVNEWTEALEDDLFKLLQAKRNRRAQP
jgi:hypothetical protein